MILSAIKKVAVRRSGLSSNRITNWLRVSFSSLSSFCSSELRAKYAISQAEIKAEANSKSMASIPAITGPIVRSYTMICRNKSDSMSGSKWISFSYTSGLERQVILCTGCLKRRTCQWLGSCRLDNRLWVRGSRSLCICRIDRTRSRIIEFNAISMDFCYISFTS